MPNRNTVIPGKEGQGQLADLQRNRWRIVGSLDGRKGATPTKVCEHEANCAWTFGRCSSFMNRRWGQPLAITIPCTAYAEPWMRADSSL
jgi:hypothetical protein